MYKKIIKRILDLIFATLGLIILWPFFLIIAAAIKIDSKGPVFFKQKRIGKYKNEFNILKFRTMKSETPRDIPTHLLDNPDIFITSIGGFLRKSSLDELPQLINIVKSEMSFIGPRPALWNQYDLISLRDKYGANNIYPGLSGWAQVNGRDELTIDVKAKYDKEYVENISLGLDLKCLILTLTIALFPKSFSERKSGKNQK